MKGASEAPKYRLDDVTNRSLVSVDIFQQCDADRRGKHMGRSISNSEHGRKAISVQCSKSQPRVSEGLRCIGVDVR